MFNVVVVDDDKRLAKSIAKYCEDCELVDKVKYEYNSEKFSDDLDENIYHTFNLFLLDIDMPISGDKLARKIKDKYSDSYIVFISNYNDRGEIYSDNLSYASGILDKPVSKEKLYKKLYQLSTKSLVLRLRNLYYEDDSVVVKPISTNDIIAITKDVRITTKDMPKNDIALFLNNGCYRLGASLEGFVKEHNISEKQFIKISGSTYLNLNSIKEFSLTQSYIKTKNDLKIDVARNYKSAFEIIKNHFSHK